MKQEGTWHVPPIACPNLVTLLLRDCIIEGLQNIKYMSKLNVLELYVPGEYNVGEIGELVLLEYLSLQLAGDEFPKEVKNLKNLKVFDLYLTDTSIESIPLEVISSLQQLKVLMVGSPCRVGDSNVEAEFLEKVESLPKIEELIFTITSKNGLNKLLDSHKLQSIIYTLPLMELLDTIEIPLILACLSKMKRLRQFVMYCDTNIVEEDYSSCIYDTLCLTMLQCVSIHGCITLKHVTWIRYAPFLQLLSIGQCDSMEQVIKEEATKDENVDSSSLFSSLVELTLYLMPNLQSIHKTALSFPSLKSIDICSCEKLNKLPLDSNSAKHKSTLIRGEQDWWDNLEWDDPAAKHIFQSKFRP